MALNWVTKTIRRMTRRKVTERWGGGGESHYEVTPHAVWSLGISLMKRNRPKAPTAIHSPLGLKFLPLEKANATADYREDEFTPRLM